MMYPTDKLELLANGGWVKQEKSRGSEKIAQGADSVFCYDTPTGDQLDVCYFEKVQKLRFRIYSPKERDVRWFEIEIDERFNDLLTELMGIQDSIAFDSYFSFYFSMQSLCKISILAWEQWE